MSWSSPPERTRPDQINDFWAKNIFEKFPTQRGWVAPRRIDLSLRTWLGRLMFSPQFLLILFATPQRKIPLRMRFLEISKKNGSWELFRGV